MTKFITIIFLCMILSFASKAQLIIDSLNVSPNPFPNRTLVYFSNSQTDTISIVIYNPIGTPVLTLFTDSIMTSNIHTDSLKMSTFSDGIYYVHLKLGHRKTIIKKIIIQSSVGLNELVEDKGIGVYPIPFTENITIQIPKSYNLLETVINITDNLGHIYLIIQPNDFNQQFNFSFFTSGTYNLSIRDNSKKNIKIVK